MPEQPRTSTATPTPGVTVSGGAHTSLPWLAPAAAPWGRPGARGRDRRRALRRVEARASPRTAVAGGRGIPGRRRPRTGPGHRRGGARRRSRQPARRVDPAAGGEPPARPVRGAGPDDAALLGP